MPTIAELKQEAKKKKIVGTQTFKLKRQWLEALGYVNLQVKFNWYYHTMPANSPLKRMVDVALQSRFLDSPTPESFHVFAYDEQAIVGMVVGTHNRMTLALNSLYKLKDVKVVKLTNVSPTADGLPACLCYFRAADPKKWQVTDKNGELWTESRCYEKEKAQGQMIFTKV